MRHPGLTNGMWGYLDPGVERAPTPNVSLQCGTWQSQWGLQWRSIQCSKPTAREVELLSGNRKDQKAKAVTRKGTGRHNWTDRAIPTLKGGWRDPGASPKERCEDYLSREKLGARIILCKRNREANRLERHRLAPSQPDCS